MKLTERHIEILKSASAFDRYRPTDAKRFVACQELVQLGLLVWHDEVEPTYYRTTLDGEAVATDAVSAPKSARFYVVKAA